MSLEDTIKKSIKFAGVAAINFGIVYTIQKTIGSLDSSTEYTNILYTAFMSAGLTTAYYVGETYK